MLRNTFDHLPHGGERRDIRSGVNKYIKVMVLIKLSQETDGITINSALFMNTK